METLHTILLVIQVLVSISVISLILIQHGKGADAGAAFGSGASHTVFGAQGSGNFLTRTTAILAFIFLTNSLGLSYIATQRTQVSRSLMDQPVNGSLLDTSKPSDAVDQIPADPTSGAVNEVPAEPLSSAVNEIPADPVNETVNESSSVPVIDPATITPAETDVKPAE